jgi:hypothetical protein
MLILVKISIRRGEMSHRESESNGRPSATLYRRRKKPGAKYEESRLALAGATVMYSEQAITG